VLAIIISVITVIISILVLAGNLILRYRQLYAQMLASESRLRAIVDTAVDGIITIDVQGAILAMNHAAEKMFGWTLAEIRFKNIKVLMPESFHTYHRSGEPVIGVGREATAVCRDGSIIPVRVAVGKAEVPGQTLFVGFVTDISDRIAMERELSAREQQYRTLITNIPGVAFRCQATMPWPVIFISDAVEKLTGWKAEKFFAREVNLGDLIHPDDAPIERELREALEQKRSYTLEYRMKHRDGSERWISESASGVYDESGTLAWIDGVLIDITESKRRAAEFEGVVKAIRRALAVVEFDLSGQVLDANNNFLTLTGYRLSDVVGKHHRELSLPEETRSDNYSKFWDNLNNGHFQSGEFCLLGHDGKPIWIQATYNPIFDADGKPWKIFQIAIDLSDRRAMETDLVIAKNRAEQASIAKGMFLANMSHEIRTPMNAIIGFTELLIDSPLQPTQLRHLKTVRQSARSLLGLLNDILDTAKLERGALELEKSAFSLKELCCQIVNELRVQADKKQLSLTVDYPSDVRDLVVGDMLRVRQVLVNLLGNAIKFTQEGQVTVRVQDAGKFLNIQVIDTGIGIPADRLEHIFTPFAQADASMARRFGGTGLGTTIARQLTELMGGRITVTSQPGKGSCFDVHLPLIAAHAVSAPVAAEAPVLPPLDILVVDDVPQNVEVLELMLTRDGHRVISANGGLQAWNLYQEHSFHVVLMDIQMAGVDGLQTTRIIREWEKLHGKIPTSIIALTANVLEQDRQDASAAGMNGFASKPVDIVELYHEIAHCLGLSQKDAAQMLLFDTPAALPKNLPVIDWDAAIARWGSRDTLHNAIERFCRDYQQQGRLSEREQVQQEAHRVKGTAANLGLVALAKAAHAIEENPCADGVLLAAFEAAFTQVLQQLKLASPAVSHESIAAITEVAQSLLLSLQLAYSHGTFDEDGYEQLKQFLPASNLKPLDEALEQFDFDAAAQVVAQWLATASWVNKTE
jgi:two-component system sensor histidine kinase/response regulator